MDSVTENILLERIERLNIIGKALSAEQNLDPLLEKILFGAKELTGADGGSLYILKDNTLHFALVLTTSLGIHMGGTSERQVTFPSIPVCLEDGRKNLNTVVTRAVNEERIINIPDAYADSEYDFSGTRYFDTINGYHSKSFLTVPMPDHENRIIGVLQLINAIDDSGNIRSFSQMDESLVSSLASQAAVALSRKGLIDGLEELLQSLVQLIATAIDDKSAATGNHCRRVPPITMSLAHAVNQDRGPLFGHLQLTDQELKELNMAAWLHDCGKITTPESVVNKQTRLETIFDRIDLIDARLEILRRDLQVEGQIERVGQSYPDINEIQKFIHSCNSGATFMDDGKKRRLEDLAAISVYFYNQSEDKPLISKNELYNLLTTRGTLTTEERLVINSHVDASIRMLSALPFPEHLKNIPEIAGGHHEKMDGSGYPLGIPAGKLSIQARILAVADIFEALTASDRVYRKSNTISEALTIMARMCKEQHIDPDLLELFLCSAAYREYAKEYLQPDQIDDVNIDSILAIFRT